jgi:hypothetical protein
MSGNTRIFQALGSSDSTLGKNLKFETLAAMTMSIFLMLWASTAWSYTVSGTTYGTNGSQSDVQAACNAAPDSGTVTVVIPNGTYSWSGTLTIAKSLTLAGQSATGVTINNNNATSDMIDATSSANGHLNIYWLNIVQVANNGGGVGFSISAGRNDASPYTVMIHDCSFNNSNIFTYMVVAGANGILFWNDTFVGDGYNGIGGISLVCNKYGDGTNHNIGGWNTASTMGAADTTGLNNTYIEDCTFSNGPTAMINADDNSRVVFRHNIVIDSDVHAHGQDTSQYGVRHIEIYNNTFHDDGQSGNLNLFSWTYVRGGTFIMANNQVDALPYDRASFIMICQSINRSGFIPCQTAYPAARQVGIGWSSSSNSTYGHPAILGPIPGYPNLGNDGVGQVSDPAYIWGNTGSGGGGYINEIYVDQYVPDDCGNGLLDSNFIVRGRDYYDDGNAPSGRPGWSAYTYPHPLHAQFGSIGSSPTPTPAPNGTPLPPQNLRVVN